MNTVNWKWFRYDEIFEIKKGKRLTKADMIEGKINYIGATDSNNGITARIANDEHIHNSNTITVSYNGSIAEAFYQSKPFWATDDVNVLYPKFHLTPLTAMFICVIIHKEKYRFNYGRKWDKEMMEKSKMKLPVNSKNLPDWNWIENYTKNNLISQLPQKSKAVWENSTDITPASENKLQLNTEKWEFFKISEIFRLEKCKCSNATEFLEDGNDIAYIGAKKNENGIMRYVQLVPDLVTKRNCIVFIGDGQGSVGFTTYQPKNFIGSTTLTAGYSRYLNEYNAQFLVSVLDMERYRYSFGRKYGHTVVKQSKIKLPTTSKGEPDWEFMENYIKGLPYSKCL